MALHPPGELGPIGDCRARIDGDLSAGVRVVSSRVVLQPVSRCRHQVCRIRRRYGEDEGREGEERRREEVEMS